jgi:2-oxoglutarate ferredoxin oxidoreductase subunit gamma
MFILGGLIKVHPIVSVDNVRKALYKTLPQRHHSQIPENEAALLRGMDIIRKIQ